MKKIYLLLYYSSLIYLPKSGFPVLGKVAKKLRYYCCRRLFASCGKNVNIERGAKFGSGKDIRIGDNSGIGINAKVPNDIVIGANVMMGPDVIIFSQNHVFDKTDIPMIRQGMAKKEKVVIGDDVWIGERVIIMPGKSIGRSSIIGAGSVVTKNIPELVIAAGNPAMVKKSRI